MASGDHYEILDFQELQGQECLNVYVYQATGSDVNAVNVKTVFNDGVAVHMLDLQNEHITHTHIQVINLDDPTDFSDTVVEEAGNVSGDCLPPYDAFAIRFVRTSREVRHAHKRIAGVSESAQAQGTLNSGTITNLEAIAAFIAGPIVSSDPAITLTFKIWRRPTLSAPQQFFDIGSYVVNTNVSTQVSRKIGRGV